MFCPSYRSSLLKALVLVLVVVTSSQPMHLSPELRGATRYPSVLPRASVSPMPRSASLDVSNPPRDLVPSPKLSAVAASFDFAVSVSPGSGSVVQSASLSSIIVSATLLSGTSTSIVFGTQNIPVGITPSFTVASCNMPCYSSLTFSATPTMPTGSYQVTITGTANGMTRTANFQLNVNPFGFCLSVSSPSGPLIQSGTISVVVTACLPYGDSSSTTSVTINPPSPQDLPTGVTPSPSVPVSCNPNCSSTLTLTATPNAILGTYNIPITSTEGTQTKMVTLPLTVASSGMSASPPSATVVQTASVSAVITDTLPSGTLSVSPASSGITPTFSGLRCNFDTNVCSSTLTFSADSSLTTGIYGFTITDTGRGFTHSIPFSLTVSLFDFSLSASSASATVVQTASVSISVSAVLPFSDTASTNSVSFSVPNPPPTTVTIGFSPISCSLNFQPSCGSTITFSADSSASIGSTYNFGIRAVGGSVTKTIPFSLTIAGFSFSISLSSSSATVVQSASVSTTVSVALPNSDTSSTTSISFQI